MIVYAILDSRSSADHPLGDAHRDVHPPRGCRAIHRGGSRRRSPARELPAAFLCESGRKFWFFGASTCPEGRNDQGGACCGYVVAVVADAWGGNTQNPTGTDIGPSLPNISRAVPVSYLRIEERELEAGGLN